MATGWNFTSGWTPTNATINDSNTFTIDISAGYILIAMAWGGKRYRMRIAGTAAGGITNFFVMGTSTYKGGMTGTFDETFEFTADHPDKSLVLRGVGTGQIDITIFSLVEIGATLALTPESWQSDKPYDLANNSACAYPVSGWSLTRPNPKKLWQPTPTAKTTAVTLTIAELLTGIITATHTAGATQAYELPTGALCDAWPVFGMDRFCEWSLINLSAAALDTVTVTAHDNHTVVGNMIVQSANAATGGVMGNSALFRTRKTAANTFITYRIS